MRERLVTWALVIVLALVSLKLWHWAGEERARADGVQAELIKLRDKHKALQADITKLEQKRETSRKDLMDALEKNKDWADGPVPTAVVDSLCKRLRCS